MEYRYFTISGGDDSKVQWWPWNTLNDALTRQLIVVDMLYEKYHNSTSVSDLEYIHSVLKETFADNTSLDGMTAVHALKTMMKFSTTIDWMVYVQNKFLHVLQSEIKKRIQKLGKDISDVDNIYDALGMIDFDDEGVKLRNDLYDEFYNIIVYNMDEIYTEVVKINKLSFTDKLIDDIQSDMKEYEVSLQIQSILSVAKRNALILDFIQKKKILDGLFIKSANMSEYLSKLE